MEPQSRPRPSREARIEFAMLRHNCFTYRRFSSNIKIPQHGSENEGECESMIYCMADIHGAYDRYLAMLQTIHFCDDDTLYVIGDVIDRGHQSIEVVLDMMSRSNVVFLCGNHEQMCLDDLHRRLWDARALWQRNGGGRTRSDLLYKRSPAVRSKILHYFLSAPTFIDLEVNGRKFHLVHGFPSENEHDRLWTRPESNAEPPIPNATVIVGHTPTSFLIGEDESPLRIWHGNGIIDIDCGCAGRSELSRLACIRLDDMQEFYI